MVGRCPECGYEYFGDPDHHTEYHLAYAHRRIKDLEQVLYFGGRLFVNTVRTLLRGAK